MKKLVFILVSLSGLLSGCLSIAWIGYKQPAASDFETINCLQIGKQNLNPQQWQAIKEAGSDLCEVLADPEFRQRVEAKTWLASCSKKQGKPDTISGRDVYRLLMQKIPRYSIHPHVPWQAEGQAENGKSEKYNRIAIAPSQIDAWYLPPDTVRSALINILVHETIHIISEDFLDYDGHASSGCPDAQLVSYGIADLAEEIWLKKHKK